MKTVIAIASAALACACGATANAASPLAYTLTGLYNTGVDDSGAKLADFGATDTHYVLNGDVAGSPVTFQDGAYAVAPDAVFIAAQADGGYTAQPNIYKLTFTASGDLSSAALSGEWAVDNFGTIDLNGHQISSIPDNGTFGTLLGFSAPSADFLPGANTLEINVGDSGPPSAFIISGLQAGVSAVPEPATWAMTILGLFGVGAMLRRRHRSAWSATA